MLPCLGIAASLDPGALPSSEGSPKSSRSQEPERICLLTMPKPLSRHGCKSFLLVLFEKHDSSERAGDFCQGNLLRMGTLSPVAFQMDILFMLSVHSPAYLLGCVNHEQSIALCDS